MLKKLVIILLVSLLIGVSCSSSGSIPTGTTANVDSFIPSSFTSTELNLPVGYVETVPVTADGGFLAPLPPFTDVPYKVTINKEDAYEGARLLADQWGWYDEEAGIPQVTLYLIAPDGTLIDETTVINTKAAEVRVLDNGNYLIVKGGRDIVDSEDNPIARGLWEVDREGNIVNSLDLDISHQIAFTKEGNYILPVCGKNMFREYSPTGEVLFEWNAEDHFLKYEEGTYVAKELMPERSHIVSIYQEANEQGHTDWTHLNYVQKLANGNYVASLRNFDLVVEIDGDTGDIIWSFGAGILKQQHCPYVYGDYMYVFDNGNGRIAVVNRLTSRVVWELNGIYAPVFGDTRILPNGNLHITDPFHYRAIEVDIKTGEIVWEVQTNWIPYRVWVENSW